MTEQPVIPEPADAAGTDTLRHLAVHSFLWAYMVATLALAVPRFKPEFDQYKLQLPGVSLNVLAVSEWVEGNWHVMAIISLPILSFDGGLLALLRHFASVRWLIRPWSATLTALLVFANLIISFAVVLPWLKLHLGLAG